jgi:serine/threonine protein kinase
VACCSALKDAKNRGAFSVVKEGTNKESGEAVAIKFIEKKYIKKKHIEQLRREIEIMKKIDHPNVLSLMDIFETDKELTLVMELVSGGELFFKIVELGSFSERDAARIIYQVCEGVAYLHEQGIAHRDLKVNHTPARTVHIRACAQQLGLTVLFRSPRICSSTEKVRTWF